MFVHVASPKTTRFGCRFQHVRVHEPGLADFLEVLLIGVGWNDLVYTGSTSQLARSWAHLAAFFGIAAADKVGVTLASLRAGAATALYRSGTSFDEIQWRGRWRSRRTLEVYIQEVGALSLLATSEASQRSKITERANALPALLEFATKSLRAH